jgi:heparin binding hemagglutinin HbhA
MAITAELTKSIEKSLDSKPVYAVAGVGDLAVEKLRELSARLSTLSSVRVEPKDVQEQVGAIQKDAKARLELVQEAVRELPEQAQSVVGLLVATANDVYEDLAERGENVVGRIRRQKATGDLKDHAQSTVRRAKATRTTATKGATSTKRAAKGTVTSATKTAQAAGKATSDAADKIG